MVKNKQHYPSTHWTLITTLTTLRLLASLMTPQPPLIWFSRASAFSALRDGLLSVNGAAGNFCEGQESFLRRLRPTYDPVTYSLPSTNVSFINVFVSPQISALILSDHAQNGHLPSLPRSNAVFVDDFY